MNRSDDWQAELQPLCEAAIEDRLTPEQQARLEQLVLANPEAKRYYVSYLHLHGCLRWSAADPSLMERGTNRATFPEVVGQSRKRRVYPGLLVAAAVVLAVGLSWLLLGERQVATLASGGGCKWDSGSLPTETGARLGVGRLRLAEGVACIVFDNGAEVKLEGPAELELVSGERCVLRSGRLVAKVPPSAIGFTVDTPTAIFIDQGTEFGVNVRDGQASDLQVFNGAVDAQHLQSGKVERLLTGRNRRYSSGDVVDFDPRAEKPAVSLPGPRPGGEEARVVHISTALGRGKDAYVQPLFPSPNSSEILLLVKNTVNEKSDFNRKAYIGLDLASLAGLRILDAQLSFTFTPTGMGFASEVPDATFVVYGLTDEAADGWDEKTLRWKDAPANGPGGGGVDLEKVTPVGRFEIKQGVLEGSRSIGGPALTDFLNRDTNGIVTFILIRETKGSGRADMVHGFANKEHPHLPPPTLKLTVAPR
ncbi:MAG: DNRLRE domain-containing protein [Planctomycetia bacterium]|nr:DNRLRE domain-containing protein [Planctomycetia bacterium]